LDQSEIEQVIGIGIDSSLNMEEERLQKFQKMLNEITSLDDKKKVLWIHIYENALQDRRNSYALLFEIIGGIKSSASNHHMIGPTAAKYIERMSRANDQLLKLAELLQKAQDVAETVDAEALYKSIAQADGEN